MQRFPIANFDSKFQTYKMQTYSKDFFLVVQCLFAATVTITYSGTINETNQDNIVNISYGVSRLVNHNKRAHKKLGTFHWIYTINFDLNHYLHSAPPRTL